MNVDPRLVNPNVDREMPVFMAQTVLRLIDKGIFPSDRVATEKGYRGRIKITDPKALGYSQYPGRGNKWDYTDSHVEALAKILQRLPERPQLYGSGSDLNIYMMDADRRVGFVMAPHLTEDLRRELPTVDPVEFICYPNHEYMWRMTYFFRNPKNPAKNIGLNPWRLEMNAVLQFWFSPRDLNNANAIAVLRPATEDLDYLEELDPVVTGNGKRIEYPVAYRASNHAAYLRASKIWGSQTEERAKPYDALGNYVFRLAQISGGSFRVYTGMQNVERL